MPTRAKRACLEPGCLGYAEQFGRCEPHARPIIARRQRADRSTEAGRRFYFTTRWQALRLAVLRREPLCRTCTARGRAMPATDVDHIERHKGDPARFWNPRNLQPLCARCHAIKTSAERRRTYQEEHTND